MSTYRTLSYAILTHLKSNHDDADVNLNLIIYWIKVCANRVKFERLKKENNSLYLTSFSDRPVVVNDRGEKYVELSETVFSLSNDFGIESMYVYINDESCGNQYVKVWRTTKTKAQVLYNTPYRKPSASNPYFYPISLKEGAETTYRLMLLGLECINVDKVDLSLYVAENPNEFCEIDDEINLSPEQEKIVYYEVYNLARYMLVTPKDVANDGRDTVAEGKAGQAAAQPLKTVYADNMEQQQAQNYQ